MRESSAGEAEVLQAYQTRKETAKVRHEGIPAKLSLRERTGVEKVRGCVFCGVRNSNVTR